MPGEDRSTDLIYAHPKLMDSLLEEEIEGLPELLKCNPRRLVWCQYWYGCKAGYVKDW